MADDTTRRIRELNDCFRTSLAGGKVDMTAGVDALPDDLKHQVLKAVRTCDRFDRTNDPLALHDFGMLEIQDHRLRFTIDYFDKRNPDLGAEDTSDEATTERVLTIMRAEDY